MMTQLFITCRGSLLLVGGDPWRIPTSEDMTAPGCRRQQPLPDIDGERSVGIELDSPTLITPRALAAAWFPLRQTHSLLPAEHYRMAGKAAMLAWFDTQTRFCGVCGAPMKWNSDISKRCGECGKEIWPQLATAVIVRIERGDEILLVRARNFRGDFYGLVAGFVETGESLEQAVAREVQEETGLTISRPVYFGSQPWPYPCGLMIGFTARYISGSLHPQLSELSSAGWFDRRHLPNIPDKASIARQLIDDWLTSPSAPAE